LSTTVALRIEWGSIFIYSPLPTHNLHFDWNGHLDVFDGRLTRLEQIEFWGAFGPSRERTTELSDNSWRSAVEPGAAWNLEGVIATIEAGASCRVRLVLGAGSHEFTLEELTTSGQLVYPCGPKYSAVNIVVTLVSDSGEVSAVSRIDGDVLVAAGPLDFQGVECVREFYRTPYAWVAPGTVTHVAFENSVESTLGEQEVHGRAKAMIYNPAGGDSPEGLLWHEMPFRIRFNGHEVCATRKLFEHFRDCQLVKELEFDLPPSMFRRGENRLEFENLDAHAYLLLNRVVLEPAESQPSPTLNTGPEILRDTVLTGIDLGTVTPENGEIDRLLEDMVRRDMGRYVLFRTELHHADEADWRRWFEFCRAHGMVFSLYEIQRDPLIYLQTPMNDRVSIETKIELAQRYGGECFLGVHHHECSNLAYGWGEAEPLELRRSRSMKDASEAFVRRMRDEYDFDNAPRIHGEAAPLFQYNYEAGVDICMAETQTGNTTYLLAAARGAAAAYGKERWGVHVACHLHKQPQNETDGIIWGLNLCLGYLHGARIVYDEEALYVMFHGVHQSYFDALTRDRQERMIAFQRFAAQHPQRGTSRVRFGLLQGNHACITGGLNVGETPVKVWGGLGPESESWGYGPSENGWRLADVFLPGVFLAPIPVDRSRMRRWMSGTPHGPCDVLPAKTALEVLENYACLFLWDWNSMTPEIYRELEAYVEDGGTLFLGLPQLSTHVHREFLGNMEDLALLRDGDFSDFLGFRVRGKGASVREIEYSGQRYCIQNEAKEPEITSADLEVTAADVTILAECDGGRPALLSRRRGRGEVVTLGLWNYPGSEALLDFTRAVVQSLARAHQGDIVVEGKESIHWACYEDEGKRTLYLVDTDWTEDGCEEECQIQTGGGQRPHSVTVSHAEVTVVDLGRS
jgi:hypothetical protein